MQSVANHDGGLNQDNFELVLPEKPKDVLLDSPWTIKAVDGEDKDKE